MNGFYRFGDELMMGLALPDMGIIENSFCLAGQVYCASFLTIKMIRTGCPCI